MTGFRDNPDQTLAMTVALDNGRIDTRAALEVVRRIVPSWASVTQARPTVVSGGITNALLRLSTENQDDVLVRVYGPNTELVIDRDRENRLFARLSSAGFAPAYLGRFENGRVEQFLPGVRPLEPHEMGDLRWRAGIARTLAELHRMVPESLEPATFATLRGWMERAVQIDFDGEAAQAHHDLGLPRLQAYLDRLQQTLHDKVIPGGSSPGHAAALRVVLAHNDLLSGNVLVDERSGAVRFIDYEYGDVGHAGFDVANHFCEYAGFDSDFANGFPTQPIRWDFAATYLEAAAPHAVAPSIGDVADFDRVVQFFVLVDHLWWGTWAVLQAKHSPIDFDFMNYAQLRFAGLEFHTRLWGPTAGW